MDEYISREAIVKEIKEEIKACDVKFVEDIQIKKGLKIALRDIKAAKTADVQPVNQWISVKDRLPDATYDCLVWYSCDTAFGKCKSWGIAHCSRCDWHTKHLDGDNIEVLYWMPMPEPPQD